MALPTSGTLSLADIQAEFGGSNPIEISEYYRGGTYVVNTPTKGDIPTSGTISISDFYGAAATIPISSYSVPYGTSASLACTTAERVTVYQDSTSFNLNDPIYSDSGGSTFAVARWYKSEDQFPASRYWNGTTWFGATTGCFFQQP